MIKIGSFYILTAAEMDEIQRDMDRYYTYKVMAEMEQEGAWHEESPGPVL